MKTDSSISSKNPEAKTIKGSGVQALLFDLGRVVLDFDHSIAASRISQFCAKSPKEIFDLFFESEETVLFEAGRISPKEFYLKVKERLSLNLSFENFVPIWNEIFFLTPQNRAVYSLANALGARYKVALVSNINILHYEYLKKHFPVFSAFHKVFVSCEIGFIKPHHEVYRKALGELGVDAENTFYTDDRKELIEAAKLLGINASLFRGVKELKEDLYNLGVEA
jgi:putative hydrolase of the HAD superfamily